MESDNDKEDRVEIKKVNGNDGFDGDLCGDQFPPITNQVVNNEKDGVQGCLDQDLEYNGKGEGDDIKSKDVSEASTRKPVREKSNGYNGIMGGGLNMKFAKIMNANKIDNKLVEISTEISEKGNKRDEKGMEEVVSNGPWLVNNKPLRVQKWRVGMALEKAEPSKLPIWNYGFKEKEVQGKNKENALNNTLNNADMPFIVVLNRRVNYEKWKDNRNNDSWNGYNGTYNRQRYYGTEYKFYSGRENNGENNKKNEVNVDKTKGNSIVMNSSEKDNLEILSNKKNEKEVSTYNRFTLLNDLVAEDELVPPIEKRKIIDEYMSRENEVSEIDSHGWSKEMKKYYKDMKELFDATKDLEKEDNTKQGNQFKEELNIRNELGGEDGDVFV
nr:zinc knuckle CX2CX4HX4C [Tanacetum cinerariifolium]